MTVQARNVAAAYQPWLFDVSLVAVDREQATFPGLWQPSPAKVNGYRVQRIERQTGPNHVTDYEWFLGGDGKPWESNSPKEAATKAGQLNLSYVGRDEVTP